MVESKFLTDTQAKKELSKWTRTAHGVYVHSDGRKVLKVSDGYGHYYYYRYSATGECLTPHPEPRLLAVW